MSHPDPLAPFIKIMTERYVRSPEGKAEILAFAAELTEQERLRDALLGGALDMGGTTQGITRAQVGAAMEFLGIFNPKPEIPLEITVSGHEIVAVARRFRELEQRVAALEAGGQHIQVETR